nr:RNA-directed DNA polymerase, eukaryota, reverse transcriptase zinc-binding domain protein [Tanacetum cinerariifolium]
MLWDYLSFVIGNWDGKVVIMEDFNEVCDISQRFGSIFNKHGVKAFNSFIVNAGLVEVPLGGCSFTISSTSLDRFLSDHRPIIMLEAHYEYGLIPFKFFHYWFELDGFDKLHKESLNSRKSILKADLANLDGAIDKGEGSNADGHRRREVVEVEKVGVMEMAQKAKIKWSIEGDEELKNNDLEIEVSNEEIKRAVWDCGIDKAPGPDGFTFEIPKRGNSSFITLIPKVPNANMVKDFRPISLIGSLYKVISKVLANRLVTVLEDIVDEIQSAFVSDSQILDGPFILNENVHWCMYKKKQSMIFKVDFEKAYDSVRWDFIDDILRRFGFGEIWCKWIQSCLYSSRASVLVNGSLMKEF